MNHIKTLFLTAFLAAFAMGANAETKMSTPRAVKPKASMEACTPQSMFGLWKLAYFQEVAPPSLIKETTPKAMYEYYRFDSGGKYSYISSNVEVQRADTMSESMGKHEMFDYKTWSDGTFQFSFQGKSMSKGSCQVVTKATAGYEEGDMVLIAPHRRNMATRVLRKIQ